ncbi:MAG: hypothetical protein NDJ90_02660 [Oligoflexia bacterium]|nr:hypothetical protein [Oligoflexia bacterium]
MALVLPASAQAALIVHTNDVLGELEPCGCRSNPQGGLPRKANWLKTLGSQSLLQLDAGDLLFPTDTIPDLLLEQSKVQAEFQLRALDLLKHDAVVPGEKDFAAGFKVFQELRKKSRVKFLAANLKPKKGGSAFESSALFTRKDPSGKAVRIAVLGLVGDELAWPNELKASSPVAAAKKAVPALRKQADLVVALTHQGYEKDVALAKAVPGIDLIVGGHSQSFLQKPVKEGRTWIFQSSFRNQYVGSIPVPFDGKGYQLTSLDAGYDSPAGATTEMDKLIGGFKSAIDAINSRNEVSLAARSVTAESRQRLRTFPACAQCHLKQFDFWRKTNHANAFAPLVQKQQPRNKECLSCHSVGLGLPQGYSDVTRLVFASRPGESEGERVEEPLSQDDTLAFLSAVHKSSSLDEPVKARAADTQSLPLRDALSVVPRAWASVQCENCHAPGGDHPFAGEFSKKVEASRCVTCHTEDKAPAWYAKPGQLDTAVFRRKLNEVTCPAGELPAEE